MNTKHKLTVYLAGAMEAAENLGAGWRDKITPFFEKLDIDILNPCQFEPLQLCGLRPNRLPSTDIQLGKKVKIKHWHDLKNSDDPILYDRFLKYMRRIINYDIKLVKNHTDFIVVYWDENTNKGAGTHAELTFAFMQNIPVYCVAHANMPAWSRACCSEIFMTFEALEDFLTDEYGGGL